MQRKFLSYNTSVSVDNKRALRGSEGILEPKRMKLSDPSSSTSQPERNFTRVRKTFNEVTHEIEDVKMMFKENPLEDKENLQPVTKIHNDTRIHMGEAQLIPVKNGDIIEQVLMLFNVTRPTQQPTTRRACCVKGVDLRYGVSNMFCDTPDCRISAGDKYMEENTEELVYCLECYNEKFSTAAERENNLQSWTEKVNLNDKKEQIRACKICKIKCHQCCSLEVWAEPFICPNCPKPQEFRMKLTLDEYPRNDFERCMEENVNGFCQSYLKSQDISEATDSKFSVVTYRDKTSKMTKDLVPAKYRKAFCKKYGETIDYYERTILLFQRLGGVDVLVYVMYAQEYPQLDGKQWLVVDYMDSVAYVEPRKMSGYVFGEVIISYFAYMSRFGYENAHLFADPPVQNDDYIFHIHPDFQVYKEAGSLIRYYGSVFAKGQRDGVISRIQKFKDTQARKKYKNPTDIIPFDGGLWTRCMLEIEEDSKNDEVEPSDYNDYFNGYIKEKMKINGENNFFLKLTPHRPKIVDSGALKRHKVLGVRDEFLKECTENNWEFSSLRRAKYASVGIISLVFAALEQYDFVFLL